MKLNQQGMEDSVVPPAMTDYVARVLPNAIVHKLQNHGHFSYFYFCDECHREIMSTLFGEPQGPVEIDYQDPIKEDDYDDDDGQSQTFAKFSS